MAELICFSCQSKIKVTDRVSFRDSCFQCQADVRVCKNCTHYDEKAYNECKEPIADRVKEKDRSTHCEYFVSYFGENRQNLGSSYKSKHDLRAQAEALFLNLNKKGN